MTNVVPGQARRTALVLAVLLPFAGAAALAPHMGPDPLFALAFLAGPLAIATWLCLTRPAGTLVALFVGLAPIDFLLTFSSGFTITRLIGLAAVGALALSLPARGANRSLPAAVVFWLLALVWMIVTTLWSGDQPKTIERLASTVLPLLIVTLVALVRLDRKDLCALLGSTVGIATVVSAYAVVIHPPAPQQYSGETAGRLWISSHGVNLDPNGLAFALMTPLAIALAAAAGSGPAWRRVGGLVASVFIAGAILATESRGGLLGMGAIVAWTAINTRHRFLGAGLVAVGVAASLLQGGAWTRLFSHSGSDAEGAGRLPIWQTGFEAFRQHWAIGNGYGTFTDAYNQVYLTVPHTFYSGWSREAHNIVLACFVELGVVGGMLVLYAWWRQFRELRAIPANDPDSWLRVALSGGVLGVFVTGLFLDILVLKSAWVAPILIAALWSVRAGEAEAGRRRLVARGAGQTAAMGAWRPALNEATNAAPQPFAGISLTR